MDILFLGNSLIYYNEMPKLFSELAHAAGKVVNVQSVTKGSATISDFVNETTVVGQQALPLIKSQKWDYIIIEPSRRITPFEDTVKEAELVSAKALQRLAHDAGGEVVLYAVWGNNHGKVYEFSAETPIRIKRTQSHHIERRAHTAFMRKINVDFSAALNGVKIADAGYAFENLIAAHPAINPYFTDERHPCLAGSYLAACVIYAMIFGERVTGNPFTAELECAGTLQSIADATALDGLVPDLL